jgi:hypothetical protein
MHPPHFKYVRNKLKKTPNYKTQTTKKRKTPCENHLVEALLDLLLKNFDIFPPRRLFFFLDLLNFLLAEGTEAGEVEELNLLLELS